MSSCTECHGMAGEKYDDHGSFHCPRIKTPPKPTIQPSTELEKYAITAWISDGDGKEHTEQVVQLKIAESVLDQAVLDGRIDELESLFEYGYPGSANTGVATRKLKAPNNTIEKRLSELKGGSND